MLQWICGSGANDSGDSNDGCSGFTCLQAISTFTINQIAQWDRANVLQTIATKWQYLIECESPTNCGRLTIAKLFTPRWMHHKCSRRWETKCKLYSAPTLRNFHHGGSTARCRDPLNVVAALHLLLILLIL